MKLPISSTCLECLPLDLAPLLLSRYQGKWEHLKGWAAPGRLVWQRLFNRVAGAGKCGAGVVKLRGLTISLPGGDDVRGAE